MLTALLSTLDGLKHAYIIIDALDECSEREKLLEQISDIAGRKIGKLHILLTSRKEWDIKTALDPILTGSVSIESAKVDSDIRLYVCRRLENDPRLKDWPDTVKLEIENSLVNGAHGMYDATFLIYANRLMLNL